MRESWNEFKELVKIFYSNMDKFLKYQIVTKILIALIFLPLFKWTGTMLMRSRGLSYITNGLLKRFLISPQGVFMIILGILFACGVFLIELGGLTVICHKALKRERIPRFTNIMKYSLGKMKYLMGVDGILVLVYIFLIAPLLNNDITSGLLKKLKIPGFIMDVIESSWSYSLYLGIVFVVLVILALRWMFVVQTVMLRDGKRPLKASSKVIKNNLWKVIKYQIGVGIFELLFILLAFVVYMIIGMVIVMIAGEENIEVVVISMLSIGVVIGYIGAFFLVPIEMMKLTRIYHRLNKEPIEVNIQDEYVEKKKRRKNKVILGLVFVVGIAVISFFGNVLVLVMQDMKYEVAITAHRGSSTDAPENTLAAIDAAVKNGAQFAEIDVQQTKDGKLVLLHDKSLLRTTGLDKNVWELTLDEIKELDAGSIFSEEFKGEKIPTLQEIIDYSKGRIRLNIEIKTNGHETDLVEKVIKRIKDNNIVRDCVVSSLDYSVIEEVEEKEPFIRTGYIMFVALGDLQKLNVDFYSVEESNVTDKFIQKAHDINREVHVWTINDTEDLDRLITMGVDNIITDKDGEFIQWIKNKKEENKNMLSQ